LSLADGLLTVLFPSHCRFCQAPLTRMSLTPVCHTCLDAIRPIEGPRCGACGERLMSRHLMSQVDRREGTSTPERTTAARSGDPGACATNAGATPPLCGMCRQNEPAFTRASAYGSYDAGLRELVHLLKYERVRPAANVLGRMLAEVVADLAEAFGPKTPVVMAVPLHASKMRQRGFNQSELIARAMLKLRPAALEAKLNTTALVRSRATESQTGLTPPQRRENVRGAFKVVRSDQISGRDILLVDDVFTTGTTVSECAKVLRRAGAARVFVATVARVLKPEAERVEPEFEEPRAMSAHA
jgi:ComF family protein